MKQLTKKKKAAKHEFPPVRLSRHLYNPLSLGFVILLSFSLSTHIKMLLKALNKEVERYNKKLTN